MAKRAKAKAKTKRAAGKAAGKKSAGRKSAGGKPAGAAKPSPIPKGYRSIQPYLIVDGAAKAIAFYKAAFGAKERLRMDAPGGRIGHAELEIGDCVVMLADEAPQWEAYAKRMVHPEGWRVRLSPHESGTGVMSYNPKTGVGLSIQPLYGNDTSPPGMLVVGSYFPAGTLPKFTDELKRRMEADAGRDLGPEYSVLARYSALAPSIEGIELTVMKVKQ